MLIETISNGTAPKISVTYAIKMTDNKIEDGAEALFGEDMTY